MRPAIRSVSLPHTVQLLQGLLRHRLSISVFLLLAPCHGCCHGVQEGNGGSLKAGAEREGLEDGGARERERNGAVDKDTDELE